MPLDKMFSSLSSDAGGSLLSFAHAFENAHPWLSYRSDNIAMGRWLPFVSFWKPRNFHELFVTYYLYYIKEIGYRLLMDGCDCELV